MVEQVSSVKMGKFSVFFFRKVGALGQLKLAS